MLPLEGVPRLTEYIHYALGSKKILQGNAKSKLLENSDKDNILIFYSKEMTYSQACSKEWSMDDTLDFIKMNFYQMCQILLADYHYLYNIDSSSVTLLIEQLLPTITSNVVQERSIKIATALFLDAFYKLSNSLGIHMDRHKKSLAADEDNNPATHYGENQLLFYMHKYWVLRSYTLEHFNQRLEIRTSSRTEHKKQKFFEDTMKCAELMSQYHQLDTDSARKYESSISYTYMTVEQRIRELIGKIHTHKTKVQQEKQEYQTRKRNYEKYRKQKEMGNCMNDESTWVHKIHEGVYQPILEIKIAEFKDKIIRSTFDISLSFVKHICEGLWHLSKNYFEPIITEIKRKGDEIKEIYGKRFKLVEIYESAIMVGYDIESLDI
jgi:hypothetical protein